MPRTKKPYIVQMLKGENWVDLTREEIGEPKDALAADKALKALGKAGEYRILQFVRTRTVTATSVQKVTVS